MRMMTVKKGPLIAAVTLGLLVCSWLLSLRPASKSDIDYEAFGRLPVLEGGRVKPLDSFARGALLSIRGKQSVPVDGRALSATRWLIDAAFKPEAADTYPAFVVDDPEVLGLLGLAQGKTRYFAYWQIEPRRGEISNQAAAADRQESGRRSRFQNALLNLNSRLTLYERLKNTFMISGQGDPGTDLAAFAALLPTARSAFRSKKPTDKERRAMEASAEILQRYKFLAQTAAFKALPPKEGAPADAWTNTGEALSTPNGGRAPHPSLASFALMGRAYRAADAPAFNAALSAHAAWVARNRPAAVRAARAEA
ncbi:MAG: hypothetical protein AAB262_12265, partial [Elusimicrobiota bacterium]